MLKIEGLRTGYGAAEIIHGIDLHVEPGEVVVVLGPNGAGKTTLLRAISGLIRVFKGTISFDDASIQRVVPENRARMGLVHVPEGRGILRSLSVHENLLLAETAGRQRKGSGSWTINMVLELFPQLGTMRNRPSVNLSGGQMQMLAIARGLLSQPRVFMLDEPSFGLAPVIIKDIYSVLVDLGKEGTTMLIVEQNAAVLDMASRIYVMRNGQIVLDSEGATLPTREALIAAYMGVGKTPVI